MMAEEMAEEYAEGMAMYYESAHGSVPSQFEKYLKKAYLAGLKAGKDINVPIKWHDLRKNPDDLPPIKEGCKYVSINVLTNEEKIVFYSYKVNCWLDFNLNEIPPFKAWCNIPKFEEKKI